MRTRRWAFSISSRSIFPILRAAVQLPSSHEIGVMAGSIFFSSLATIRSAPSASDERTREAGTPVGARLWRAATATALSSRDSQLKATAFSRGSRSPSPRAGNEQCRGSTKLPATSRPCLRRLSSVSLRARGHARLFCLARRASLRPFSLIAWRWLFLFRRLQAHDDLFAPRPPDLAVVPGSQEQHPQHLFHAATR